MVPRLQSLWALQMCHTGLPHSLWDLSSLNRSPTCVPCIGRQILGQLTTKEAPGHQVLTLTAAVAMSAPSPRSWGRGHGGREMLRSQVS